MSRREGRDSNSKRHRSRYDREPSPKRSRREDERRNGKPTNKIQFDNNDGDESRKLRRSPPDTLHVESEIGAVIKEPDKRGDGLPDLTKHTADPSKVERSRSYFQHDDRGSLGQSGRSIGRRSDRDSGPWRYSREHQNDREESYSRRKSEIYEPNKRDDRVWRHDGYFEMEANPKPVVTKRPSFREQKIQPEPKNLDEKYGADHVARNPQDRPFEAGRRDQRWHPSDRSFRAERSYARGTEFNRTEQCGDRHSDTGFRGRERLPPRQGYRPTGGLVEKWKHDLYDEANKSPSPKNEEDQVSKIEALLAS